MSSKKIRIEIRVLRYFGCLVTALLMACQAVYGGISMQVEDFFRDPNILALIKAAERGDTAGVHKLVKAGVDVNASGNEGMTPLMWMLVQKNKPAIRTLLSAGANPDLKDKDGDSPVSMAAGAKDSDFLKMFLNSDANPNSTNRNGEPLLIVAIGEMRPDNVELLLNSGANVNLRDRTGATPLLAAATLNQYDLVWQLMERGADVHLAKPTGATLAWRVQQSRINPHSPQYQWRERVKRALEERGIRFPVPHPAQQ